MKVCRDASNNLRNLTGKVQNERSQKYINYRRYTKHLGIGKNNHEEEYASLESNVLDNRPQVKLSTVQRVKAMQNFTKTDTKVFRSDLKI